MNRKHTKILQDHYHLLSKNVIPSEDFYRMLVTYDIFTDNDVQGIQKMPKKDRIPQLMEDVLRKRDECFGRLCDLLDVTGHHFLSDCLREADNYDKPEDVQLDDVYSKFPQLSKVFKTPQQRQDLEGYVKDKISKEVVKQTWKGDVRTKEQLIFHRQKQIEQNWKYVAEAKVKDKSITELQDDYLDLQKVHEDTQRELKTLQRHIEDLNRKHQEEVQTQINFNMANDRQITREHAKAASADDYLATIRDGLERSMGTDFEHHELKIPYESLVINFHRFVETAEKTQDLASFLREERQYVGAHLGIDRILDNESIRPSFQKYVLAKEEAVNLAEQNNRRLSTSIVTKVDMIEALRTQNESLEEQYREAMGEMENGRSLKDILAAKDSDLRDARTALKQRDEKLTTYSQTNRSLKTRVTEVEADLREMRKRNPLGPIPMSAAPLHSNEPLKSPRAPEKFERLPQVPERTSQHPPMLPVPRMASSPVLMPTPVNSSASVISPPVNIVLGDHECHSPVAISLPRPPAPLRYKPLRALGSVSSQVLANSGNSPLNARKPGPMPVESITGRSFSNGAAGFRPGPVKVVNYSSSYGVEDQSLGRKGAFKVDEASMVTGGGLRNGFIEVPYTRTQHSKKIDAARTVKVRRL